MPTTPGESVGASSRWPPVDPELRVVRRTPERILVAALSAFRPRARRPRSSSPSSKALCRSASRCPQAVASPCRTPVRAPVAAPRCQARVRPACRAAAARRLATSPAAADLATAQLGSEVSPTRDLGTAETHLDRDGRRRALSSEWASCSGVPWASHRGSRSGSSWASPKGSRVPREARSGWLRASPTGLPAPREAPKGPRRLPRPNGMLQDGAGREGSGSRGRRC